MSHCDQLWLVSQLNLRRDSLKGWPSIVLYFCYWVYHCCQTEIFESVRVEDCVHRKCCLMLAADDI